MPASPSASVFINCPFDKEYQPLFDAIAFCVSACGFVPRCTLELTDAGEVRIENIYRLIAQCNHGIHDISRTEVKGQPYQLPRFNMPLELGIFLGAKRFGAHSSQKRCLIMDRAPYRYKRFSPTSEVRISKRTTEVRPRQFDAYAIGYNLHPAKRRFLAVP